jgi:hypothetical protein
MTEQAISPSVTTQAISPSVATQAISPLRHRNSADNMVPARPQPPVGHNSMRAVAGRLTRLAVDMDSLHEPADRRNTQVAAVPPEAGRQPPLPCQVPD